MSIRIVVACLFLTGCSIYGGISIHPEGADNPEFYAPNPIGIIGGEIECPFDTVCFIEHRSSITNREEGYGLNELGVKKSIEVW